MKFVVAYYTFSGLNQCKTTLSSHSVELIHTLYAWLKKQKKNKTIPHRQILLYFLKKKSRFLFTKRTAYHENIDFASAYGKIVGRKE